MKIRNSGRLSIFGFVLASSLLLPLGAMAHCDSLDGPVIRDARIALTTKDAAPVLKWVQKKHEREILETFRQAQAVRGKGKEAQALADRYFFETLVRIHRQGEGEAFTGLKPETGIDPGIAAADKALQQGTASELKAHVSSAVAEGLQKRFDAAAKLKEHARDSAEAGRKYVAAYVEYIHYVERLHQLVSQRTPHAHAAESSPRHDAHHE